MFIKTFGERQNHADIGMIHIRRPWKLCNLQDPPRPLSIYIQNFSTPWTLDVNFKWTPLPTLLTLFNILWNNNRTVHVTKSRNKTKIRHIQINHDLAHKQFNVMIEVWLHYLTSASIGRFLVNKILFDSAWCLFMAQIKFSIINKIKIGRPEHLLPPKHLRPITSKFCLSSLRPH